jgi:hypothetical protein
MTPEACPMNADRGGYCSIFGQFTATESSPRNMVTTVMNTSFRLYCTGKEAEHQLFTFSHWSKLGTANCAWLAGISGDRPLGQSGQYGNSDSCRHKPRTSLLLWFYTVWQLYNATDFILTKIEIPSMKQCMPPMCPTFICNLATPQRPTLSMTGNMLPCCAGSERAPQTEVTIGRAPLWRCSRHPRSCDVESSGHTTRRPAEVVPVFGRSCHSLYRCRTDVLWIKCR